MRLKLIAKIDCENLNSILRGPKSTARGSNLTPRGPRSTLRGPKLTRRDQISTPRGSGSTPIGLKSDHSSPKFAMKPKINFKRSKIYFQMPKIDSQKFKIDAQRTKTDSQWPKFRKLSISVDTGGVDVKKMSKTRSFWSKSQRFVKIQLKSIIQSPFRKQLKSLLKCMTAHWVVMGDPVRLA